VVAEPRLKGRCAPHGDAHRFPATFSFLLFQACVAALELDSVALEGV
jgi:hypothetical protein